MASSGICDVFLVFGVILLASADAATRIARSPQFGSMSQANAQASAFGGGPYPIHHPAHFGPSPVGPGFGRGPGGLRSPGFGGPGFGRPGFGGPRNNGGLSISISKSVSIGGGSGGSSQSQASSVARGK